jgi:hypothetical protein
LAIVFYVFYHYLIFWSLCSMSFIIIWSFGLCVLCLLSLFDLLIFMFYVFYHCLTFWSLCSMSFIIIWSFDLYVLCLLSLFDLLVFVFYAFYHCLTFWCLRSMSFFGLQPLISPLVFLSKRFLTISDFFLPKMMMSLLYYLTFIHYPFRNSIPGTTRVWKAML